MISKAWQELISKYSFIEKVDQKGAYVFFTYFADSKATVSKISIRANAKQVARLLEKIRDKVGVSVHGKGLKSDYFII